MIKKASRRFKGMWKRIALIACIAFLFVMGAVILWVATLEIPDLQAFEDKILAGSTKIYDKKGETVLFNLNQDARQQVVPISQISPYIKDATVAIEDESFYRHRGIEFSSIIRAVLANLTTLRFSQGGSTITQQVIKNSLLTTDKKISRKIKEWVLALKLERVMAKEEILNLYLNGTSYGGPYYGIEEASKNFFATSSQHVTLAQAAYLAALPQAPSLYSPYGKNKERLEARKNLVLTKMVEYGYISQAEADAAKAEVVTFKAQERQSIKAPHFSMYIRDYLIDKYGEDMVKNGNLKVITTLDYELQQKAEEIVKKYALENTTKFNASNASLVAIDPTNGQILVMVGSRDYFDDKIDGNFNVALAHRQPGSAFKPFAYLTAFNKGYTPDTVLFDLPTQFGTTCTETGAPTSDGANCYAPQNYDNKFRGPMSMRNALAQSINVPAIKTLYLAGLRDTLRTSQDLGITSLGNVNQYGLTLVLGGGEVSPLEMTSAYATFANNGVHNAHTGILRIEDREGKVLEEFIQNPLQVVPEQSVLQLNDILRDNNARVPALFSPGSTGDFRNREVAFKTGTTNDYRDVWIVGYTPHIAVGAWGGNNDNSPMVKKTSGTIIVPLWRAFMDEALKKVPEETFKRPEPIDPNLKPILRGLWQGGQTYTIDKSSGKLATEFTPPELREERSTGEVHSILYWVDRNDPKGPPPSNPASDPQFNLWEGPVRAWAQANAGISSTTPPTETDDVHTADARPQISITSPYNTVSVDRNEKVTVTINAQSKFPMKKVEFYVNDVNIGSSNQSPYTYSFTSADIKNIQSSNTLKVIGYDQHDNKGEAQINFSVR